MINQSDITVIIPHLGSSKEQEYSLDQCLLSLKETVPNIKVIVAKNGAECLHSGDVWVREQGQCKSVNVAASMVDTEWIMVTNDDMVYPPGWFDSLVGGLPDNVMCISPKLIEPRLGAPTFEVYFCGGAGGDFNKQSWLEFAKDYFDNNRGQGIRTGFNLPFLIKREAFNLIGQYDVKMDPWGSNSDSCLQTRIMLAGIQPMQNTNSIVYHFSQTSGTGNSDNRPYWQRNWDYYITKYGFERKSSPEIWISQNIIDYDKLKFHPWWEGYYAKS